MAICWLRFFLRLGDEVVWTLLQEFGPMGGINTDDLERLLIQHDLLGAPHLFFFEPAVTDGPMHHRWGGTSIVTDGPMHHLTDAGDDQQGAGALTALQVVAEMRCSDKRLGSGKCEGGGCREKSIKTMYEAKEKE
jgi:hypothetical protein